MHEKLSLLANFIYQNGNEKLQGIQHMEINYKSEAQ
jgi:hypothetical protein